MNNDMLPTNDEVYAAVCKARGSSSLYVSTNAVNDVMAAVRALATSASPERSGKLADDEEEAAFQQRFRECMRAAIALSAPEADSSSAAPSDVCTNNGAKPGMACPYCKPAAPSPTVGSAAPSDLEIRVRKVLEGVHIETGRTEEFECVVANMVAAIGATAPTGEGAWKALADKAIAVLCRHIVPDGISDKEALSELYGIFDGPEYRAALATPSPTGGSQSDGHSDDIAVDRFAAAIKSEMAAQRARGRGGWDDPAQCHVQDLAASMVRQIDNGNILAASAYAMMLFNRNCWPADLVGAMSAHFQEARRAALATPRQTEDSGPGMPRVISDTVEDGVHRITTAYTLCTCGGAAKRQPDDDSGLSAAGWFVEIKHNDGSTTITSTRPEIDGAFQLFRPYVSGARPAPKETAVQGGVPGDWEISYDRWSQPGTIRLASAKWGGTFLSAPPPGCIRLPSLVYHLLADMLAAAPTGASHGE